MRIKTTIDLFEYWNRIRGQDLAPLRSQVEPTDLRQILSSVFLLETSDAGRVAFRLAGTRICDLFGRDLRGIPFADLFAHGHDDIEHTAAGVMSHAIPALLNATGFTAAGHRACFEIILLPLRSDDGEYDKLLGAIAPAIAASWLEVVPLQFLALDRSRLLHERLVDEARRDSVFEDEHTLYPRPLSIADTMRRVMSSLFAETDAPSVPLRHNRLRA
ncbi:hypothetical protein QO004_000144 [Rhizobium mesoamericanum]|uniref:PAS domain-containing protein n=1 Tax=Rhizobium mesoamericanum TaxID=1079800 RepID=UPI00278B2EF2|nr:PAS domain-containing protein [Rhizobium mesoamericanum]MDQ0558371.1 hypothetical protein [Rhizobium mesoamericanum]